MSRKRRSPLMEWRGLIVACDRETLDAKAKCVALVLSTHMDANGASCFPSLSTLQSEASLGRAAVVAALKTLQAAGFIVKAPGGPTTSNRYVATSSRGELGVVQISHVGSSPGEPESDQESAKSLSTRAGARAGKRKGRASALPNDNIGADLLAYDQ